MFETERTVVRRLREADVESFYDMQSNPNVMRYIKETMTFAESRKEMDRFISYYFVRGQADREEI